MGEDNPIATDTDIHISITKTIITPILPLHHRDLALCLPRISPTPIRTRTRTLIDRKSTRLNSSHGYISYAVFCLKKKKNSVAETRIDGARNDTDQHVVEVLHDQDRNLVIRACQWELSTKAQARPNDRPHDHRAS